MSNTPDPHTTDDPTREALRVVLRYMNRDGLNDLLGDVGLSIMLAKAAGREHPHAVIYRALLWEQERRAEIAALASPEDPEAFEAWLEAVSARADSL